MWIRRNEPKVRLQEMRRNRGLLGLVPLEAPWWTGAIRLMAMVGADYNLVRLTNRTPQGRLSPHHAPLL